MRPAMSRSCAFLACLGAAALVAGCNSEPAAVDVLGGTLRVQLDEYRIQPQTIRVKAGRIRIVAHDTGRLTHNLVVESITDDPNRQVVYGSTDTAHPGQTVHERDPLILKPGRYRLACTIANHENLGQYGTLIVK
jgi:plastocyanin